MSGTATFDPALVLSTILRRNAALMKTAHGFVALVNTSNNCLTVEYGMGLAENYVGRQLCDRDGVAWRVFVTGEPLAVAHYQDWDGRFRGILPKNQEQIGSVAGAPALVDGTVRAVLVFIFETAEFPTDSDIGAWLAEVAVSASGVMAQLETVSGQGDVMSPPPITITMIPPSPDVPGAPVSSAGMDIPPAY